MEDLPRQAPAANRGLLRGHRRTAVCTRPSGSWGLALSRQRMDAHHPERDPGTGRTHAQDRTRAHRLCQALGHARARVLFCRGERGGAENAIARGHREARRDAVCARRWAYVGSAWVGA